MPSAGSAWIAWHCLSNLCVLETNYRINTRFWHDYRHSWVQSQENLHRQWRCSSPTANRRGTICEYFPCPWKTTSLVRKNWDRATEAPPHHFELRKRKNTAMAVRILSLLLFLQVVFFPWLFLWSLHSFLNTRRGQFDHYFVVICVIIRLLSFPALKHCRRTDRSRILKRSERHHSLQSICQRKLSLPS